MEFQENSFDQSYNIEFGNMRISRKKLCKYLLLMFLIIGYGIIWFQDFQTYSSRPENKPGR